MEQQGIDLQSLNFQWGFIESIYNTSDFDEFFEAFLEHSLGVFTTTQEEDTPFS